MAKCLNATAEHLVHGPSHVVINIPHALKLFHLPLFKGFFFIYIYIYEVHALQASQIKKFNFRTPDFVDVTRGNGGIL